VAASGPAGAPHVGTLALAEGNEAAFLPPDPAAGLLLLALLLLLDRAALGAKKRA